MSICPIGFKVSPYYNSYKQTQNSCVFRITAIFMGTLLLCIGIMSSYGILGQKIGPSEGATFITLGCVSCLAGVFLKFTCQSICNNPRRHSIDSQGNRKKLEEVYVEGIQDKSLFGDMPIELFYATIKHLEVPELLQFQRISKEIQKKIKKYFANHFPIKATILADHRQEAIDWEHLKGLKHWRLSKDLESQILLFELSHFMRSENQKTITHLRFLEIIEILKNKNVIYILNSISKDRRLTPLQYWALQGNLDFVKLLVAHGAKDYFSECPGNTSALFHAALEGHLHVVNYLLENGAHANIQFDKDVFRSFIPKFIFKSYTRTKLLSFRMDCFKKVLDYMAIYQPASLESQLKVPIRKDRNSVMWVEEELHVLDELKQNTPLQWLEVQEEHENFDEILKILKIYCKNDFGVIAVADPQKCLDYDFF